MNLYLFEADECAYDTYDGLVIRAKTRLKAIQLANDIDKFGGCWNTTNCTHLASNTKGKAGLILGAFNAG